MKLAITAASGKLGTSIINRLLITEDSNNVVAIARNPEKIKPMGIEIRKGDYNEKKQFQEALTDIDSLLMISGMDAPEKRIIQHGNVISAAVEAGVKKIVYTSIIGSSKGSAFSPIIESNRQTEEEIKNSGLNWVIGRNGLYIEPDVEYIENYKKAGKISNCAGEGKCSYTTRDELAYAYTKMMLEEKHIGKIYNLAGASMTQKQLTSFLNKAFNTNLEYDEMSFEDYKLERISELGEFMGIIIAGIYQGIRSGDFDITSDYKLVTGREHIRWSDYFEEIRLSQLL